MKLLKDKTVCDATLKWKSNPGSVALGADA